MSTADRYFTLPLSILRSGSSAVDALEKGLGCGIVNAGIGSRQTHGEIPFRALLAAARARALQLGLPTECPKKIDTALWEAAQAGAELLGIRGGSCADFVSTYLAQHQAGSVFLRLRTDWMWNATYHAREVAGQVVPEDRLPLSWREFRILAAILSAKVNTLGFTFLGWETIQARACGFHSKALFKAGAATLPAHCQPLSRDVIRRELEKLEALGFFARCRYSTGTRGGLMAYSFRHAKREGLAQAVKAWSAANNSFQSKAATNRADDLAAFVGKPRRAHSVPPPPPAPLLTTRPAFVPRYP